MFEITKALIAVLRNKFIVSFIIIFGTLSLPVLADTILHDLVLYTRGEADLSRQYDLGIKQTGIHYERTYLSAHTRQYATKRHHKDVHGPLSLYARERSSYTSRLYLRSAVLTWVTQGLVHVLVLHRPHRMHIA